MSILDKILDQKKLEIASLDGAALRSLALQSPTPLDFINCLNANRYGSQPALIAELKRASPSRGILAPQLDLLETADLYQQHGAAAISVLTDEAFFQGKLDTLQTLRHIRNISLPLLRKDFIIHETQLYETRAAGADAVLLIAAALPDDGLLADLHALALELGLTPLVEVHDAIEVERVLCLPNLKLIGINNRNLNTFEVTLETTEKLRPMIPQAVRVVAESGIFIASDVQRLAIAGVDAILVGEALVTASDIPAKIRELSGADHSALEEGGL
ncbi:MAG: indole-3-glycerol phosphate synthase TrpC [Anaerolineae bacterium]|nr:indole-3-glycerol phosphate synthase TrpC [Anaerolineae bacterium]